VNKFEEYEVQSGLWRFRSNSKSSQSQDWLYSGLTPGIFWYVG